MYQKNYQTWYAIGYRHLTSVIGYHLAHFPDQTGCQLKMGFYAAHIIKDFQAHQRYPQLQRFWGIHNYQQVPHFQQRT